jgi:hypothetical protein
MRMKVIKITIIMSLALAFGIAAPAAPQQSAEPTQQKQPGKQMMTMDEMMQECRKHCQETTKSIDQTTGQSNAPARMRAALDQAQKELVGMKNHMSMCMSMMDMMEKTHGKGQKKQ